MIKPIHVPPHSVKLRVIAAAIRIVARENMRELSYRSIGVEAGYSHETARLVGFERIFPALVTIAFSPLRDFIGTPGSLRPRRDVELYGAVLSALRQDCWTPKLITQVSLFAGGDSKMQSDFGFAQLWLDTAALAVNAFRRDRNDDDAAMAMTFGDSLVAFYTNAAAQLTCNPAADDLYLLSSRMVELQ